MIPGEIIAGPGEIILNQGKPVTSIVVVNLGDRPIQIGSHFHFFEVNKLLSFDRGAAYGQRLNIPAGTAIRFEPSEAKSVELIPFAGKRQIIGFNALINGQLNGAAVEQTVCQAIAQGFKHSSQILNEDK